MKGGCWLDSAEICVWALLLNIFANYVKKKVSNGVINNLELPRTIEMRASYSDQINGFWATTK